MCFCFNDRRLWDLCHSLAESDKKFTLSTAYANKSVYLIWSQVWAVLIFRENLTVNNIIGMLIVFIGVMVVQRYE